MFNKRMHYLGLEKEDLIVNKAIITGRLVRDPEARTTQSGINQSTFDVAVQRSYKNSDGKYDSDFLNVVAWRQTADYCNKYLTKGTVVAVEGSIQKRSYSAPDGSKRYVTEIIANNVEALSRPKSENAQRGEGFVDVTDEEPLPWESKP